MMNTPPSGGTSYLVENFACEMVDKNIYISPKYSYYNSSLNVFIISTGIAECMPNGNWTRYAIPFENQAPYPYNPDFLNSYGISMDNTDYFIVGSGRLNNNLVPMYSYNSISAPLQAPAGFGSYIGDSGCEITGQLILGSGTSEQIFEIPSQSWIGNQTMASPALGIMPKSLGSKK